MTFTREELEKWLWAVAHNNSGTLFCEAVVQITENLDRFEKFTKKQRTKIRLQKRDKRQVVDVLEMDEDAMADIIKVFIHDERHFECYKDGAYFRLVYWHEGKLKNVLIRLRGEE